ncbi:histidine phosphatase family protein [Brevibacillus borstelensis]|uniref:histidine phosphatase family protein n=1 Tax=Brevibacillus borstelensis TaxID=45462 RepID=UPI000F082F38|nr:histidine phosphatase family protein [Brevibacillus borstelensis]MED1744089.1 histidine phosphatase family protein [Brevibacillus borstelensis]MED1883770.1 histidine phosphatase family protein [Brevibacillus borstelensis]RNB60596.1 histidine phosphatase family protein [Brevibacillus borstelensis]GED51922.1 alpha-ribazole phosphatase [Brevibacillus borstelensis]
MRWIWIRHGETEENREGRYLGHTDVPLNDAGVEQAALLARQLGHERPAHFFTSDLLRCVQTADRLAAVWGMSPIRVPELRELSFGEWERLTYEELMVRESVRASRWYDDPFGIAPPGGETLTQLGERVNRWLSGMWKEMRDACGLTEPDHTVALVTHGGVIRWFQAAWLHGDPGLYWHMKGLGHGQAMIVEHVSGTWKPASHAIDIREESEA